MLTAWRKLHLEFDKMAAPNPSEPSEQNYVERTILARSVAGNVTTLTFAPIEEGSGSDYDGGRVEIEGLTAFETSGRPRYEILSVTPGSVSMGIVVNGTVALSVDPGAGVVGDWIRIHDDDDRYLNALGIAPPLQNYPDPGAVLTAIQPKYSPAYVQLVDVNGSGGLNGNKTVAFDLHERPIIGGVGYTTFDDAKDVFDQPGFWAHTVVLGYQDWEIADLDANAEDPWPFEILYGATPEARLLYDAPGISVIYMEQIRELALERGLEPVSDRYDPARVDYYKNEYRYWLYGIIAHEIAHPPGGEEGDTDHAEAGLMQNGGAPITSTFFPETHLRIRKAHSWNE